MIVRHVDIAAGGWLSTDLADEGEWHFLTSGWIAFVNKKTWSLEMTCCFSGKFIICGTSPVLEISALKVIGTRLSDHWRRYFNVMFPPKKEAQGSKKKKKKKAYVNIPLVHKESKTTQHLCILVSLANHYVNISRDK